MEFGIPHSVAIGMVPGIVKVLVDVLFSRGWLSERTECPTKLQAAVAAFQRWRGLDGNGELDVQTIAALNEPRFCALPDVLQMEATLCRWPDPDVTWFCRDAFPGLTLDQTRAHFRWAMSQWATASRIAPREVDSVNTARIWAIVQRLDGPNGVLADSMLPCGGTTACRQRYDSSEAWDRSIMARLVILHELGHALGIPHISSGNVMAPTYNPNLTGLQSGDIAEAVARYGQPIPTPPPAPPEPPSPPPAAGSITIDLGLKQIAAPAGWSIVTR